MSGFPRKFQLHAHARVDTHTHEFTHIGMPEDAERGATKSPAFFENKTKMEVVCSGKFGQVHPAPQTKLGYLFGPHSGALPKKKPLTLFLTEPRSQAC